MGQNTLGRRLLVSAPVDPSPPDSDEDTEFLGIVTESDQAAQQRADPEFRILMDHLEGRNVIVPRVFQPNSAAFSLKNAVLGRNFDPTTRTKYLLVIPAGLHDEILEACRDKPSSGHLGAAQALGKIKTKYYWPRMVSDVTH